MTDYIVPLILFVSMALALGRKENAYDIMLSGAADGLRLIVSILPALILLLCAVHMLQASGAADAISALLSPMFARFGIPPETALLVLVRPLSGSAALAVGADLMARYGPDSTVGRTAAVMPPSTRPMARWIGCISAANAPNGRAVMPESDVSTTTESAPSCSVTTHPSTDASTSFVRPLPERSLPCMSGR